VRNPNIQGDNLDALFRRLQERGDARRLLEILPRLYPEAAARLKGVLLSRQPLPVAEAEAVAAAPDAAAAGVAAHLLGRAAAPSSGPVIAAALRKWWGEWDTKRREEIRRGSEAGRLTRQLLEPLQALVWAAGRLGAATDALVAVATTRTDVPFDRPLRRDAAAALATGKLDAAVLAALEKLAAGDDPEIRAVAAQALAREDAARAAQVAGRVLSDRVTFNRLTAGDGVNVTDTLHKAAGQLHYQGVAVPHLAARHDVAALAAVANNRALPEEARLGAVEGLAAAATEAAEKQLEQVGRAGENSEEMRKAAWRGLRRSRRARQRAEAKR
jgi:ParB family chromosome partitioning protein